MNNNRVLNALDEGIARGIIYSIEHLYGYPLTVIGKEKLYELFVKVFGEEDAQYWMDYYKI